jgi:hypothetical protein
MKQEFNENARRVLGLLLQQDADGYTLLEKAGLKNAGELSEVLNQLLQARHPKTDTPFPLVKYVGNIYSGGVEILKAWYQIPSAGIPYARRVVEENPPRIAP